MYIINVLDDYGGISDSYEWNTLDESLDWISQKITLGEVLTSDIQLLQKIELEFEISVRVK